MAINKVILLGRVGKDPEIKQFDGGNKASFSLATTERGYVSKTGETIPDRVTWHNIVCWKGLATIAERFVKKGDLLYIEGKITNRSWERTVKRNISQRLLRTTLSCWVERVSTLKKLNLIEPEMAIEDSSDLPF